MDLMKLVIGCRVQGDVVLECVHLCSDSLREEMMFRVMFHTAFVRSYNLTLNHQEVDILWDAKEKFNADFRAEVMFADLGDVPSSFYPSETENDVPSYIIHAVKGTTIDEGNQGRAVKVEADIPSVKAQLEVYSITLAVEMFSNTDVEGTDGKGESDPSTFEDCPSSDSLRQKHEAYAVVNSNALQFVTKRPQKQKSAEDKWIPSNKGCHSYSTQAADALEQEETKHRTADPPNAVKDGEDVAGQKRSEYIIHPRKTSPDVVRNKADKLSQFVTKRPEKKKSAEHTWIPSNKGSLNNSMHVSYPHTRTIAPPIAITRNQTRDSVGGGRLMSLASSAERREHLIKMMARSGSSSPDNQTSQPMPQDPGGQAPSMQGIPQPMPRTCPTCHAIIPPESSLPPGFEAASPLLAPMDGVEDSTMLFEDNPDDMNLVKLMRGYNQDEIEDMLQSIPVATEFNLVELSELANGAQITNSPMLGVGVSSNSESAKRKQENSP